MGDLLSFAGWVNAEYIHPPHSPSPISIIHSHWRPPCLPLLLQTECLPFCQGQRQRLALLASVGGRIPPHPSPPTKLKPSPDLSALLPQARTLSLSQTHSLSPMWKCWPWGHHDGEPGLGELVFSLLGSWAGRASSGWGWTVPGSWAGGLVGGGGGVLLHKSGSFLGLAWQQRSEQGTLRLIPRPNRRGSCSVLPLWALRGGMQLR